MKLHFFLRQAILLIVLSLASTLCLAVSNPDYLCFTAEEANAKVALKKEGNPNPVSLKYSRDCITWANYVPDTTGDVLLSNVGDKVWFKATSINSKFNKLNYYYYFSITGGNVSASGNVMSLLDATCQQTNVPSFAFINLFYNCNKLTEAPQLPATQLSANCYQYMFKGCTSLRKAPELPAMQLEEYCYCDMFGHCESIRTAPALPATQLKEKCYSEMFDGCTSLVEAPNLPATQLAEGCYDFMFCNCQTLTESPVLSATQLDEECYRGMFMGCSALKKVIVNFHEWEEAGIATELWMAGVAKDGVFACPEDLSLIRDISHIPEGWIIENPDYLCFTAEEANAKVALKKEGNPNPVSLKYSRDCITWANYVPGTTGDVLLSNVGDKVWFKATSINSKFNKLNYYYYFSITGGNVSASGNVMSLLDATCQQTFVPRFAFAYLFKNCDKLTAAPELPAMQLAESCYKGMFLNCTSLSLPPELPSMQLAGGCYREMFCNCTALTEAPSILPAMQLADGCYCNMFDGCTSLSNAPELPAMQLAESCYQGMFYRCASLTKAPALPALQLEERCYAGMFSNCTSLDGVPDVLPATSLSEECYYGMFDGCSSLIVAPRLPAIQLASNCYYYMFANCTSLVAAPVLFATQLVDECYYGMFINCQSLSKVIVNFRDWQSDECSTNFWMAGVAEQGTFICPDNLPQIRDLHHIPEGWTIEHPEYLCFTAEEDSAEVALNKQGLPSAVKLKYSKDYFAWLDYVPGTFVILKNEGEKVWFRADSINNVFSSRDDFYYFTVRKKVAASGNVMSLLDADCKQTSVPSHCFLRLFSNCQKLTTAPKLPATELATGCYKNMFDHCFLLLKAPELPATQLKRDCYAGMFSCCTSLSEIKVKFVDWHYKNLKCYGTYGWLYGVADSGTFVSPSALVVQYGESYIPTSWFIDYTSDINAASVRPNTQDEPEIVASISEQPTDINDDRGSYTLSGQRVVNKQGLVVKNGKVLLVK